MIEAWARESWDFISGRFRKLFTTYLRILAISLIPVMIAAIIGAGFILFLPGTPSIVVFFVLLAIAMIFSAAFETVYITTADNLILGKKTDIMGSYWKNFVPFIKYALVYLAIIIAVVIVLAGTYIAIAFSSDSLASIAGEIFVRLLSAVIFSIFYLFLQFALFDIIVKSMGTIRGYGESIRLARNNLLDVAVISFILFVVEKVAGIPFMIVGLILGAMVFFSVVGTYSLGIVGMAMLAVSGILAFAVILLFVTFIKVINIAARYILWKKLKR